MRPRRGRQPLGMHQMALEEMLRQRFGGGSSRMSGMGRMGSAGDVDMVARNSKMGGAGGPVPGLPGLHFAGSVAEGAAKGAASSARFHSGNINDMATHPAVGWSKSQAGISSDGLGQSAINSMVNSRLGEQGITRDASGTWNIDMGANDAYRQAQRGRSGPASALPSTGVTPTRTGTGMAPGSVPGGPGATRTPVPGSTGLPPSTRPVTSGSPDGIPIPVRVPGVPPGGQRVGSTSAPPSQPLGIPMPKTLPTIQGGQRLGMDPTKVPGGSPTSPTVVPPGGVPQTGPRPVPLSPPPPASQPPTPMTATRGLPPPPVGGLKAQLPHIQGGESIPPDQIQPSGMGLGAMGYASPEALSRMQGNPSTAISPQGQGVGRTTTPTGADINPTKYPVTNGATPGGPGATQVPVPPGGVPTPMQMPQRPPGFGQGTTAVPTQQTAMPGNGSFQQGMANMQQAFGKAFGQTPASPAAIGGSLRDTIMGAVNTPQAPAGPASPATPSGTAGPVPGKVTTGYASPSAPATGDTGGLSAAADQIITQETGGQDLTGQTNCTIRPESGCLALNSGIFEATANSIGYDFNRIVNDPAYAKEAVTALLNSYAQDDASKWGGPSGISVWEWGNQNLPGGGAEAVARIYFGGDVTGQFVDEQGRSGATYGQQFMDKMYANGYSPGGSDPSLMTQPTATGQAAGGYMHPGSELGQMAAGGTGTIGSPTGAIRTDVVGYGTGGDWANYNAYDPSFDQYGKQFGVDPAILKGMAVVENGGTQSVSGPWGGGVMQVQPEWQSEADRLGLPPVNTPEGQIAMAAAILGGQASLGAPTTPGDWKANFNASFFPGGVEVATGSGITGDQYINAVETLAGDIHAAGGTTAAPVGQPGVGDVGALGVEIINAPTEFTPGGTTPSSGNNMNAPIDETSRLDPNTLQPISEMPVDPATGDVITSAGGAAPADVRPPKVTGSISPMTTPNQEMTGISQGGATPQGDGLGIYAGPDADESWVSTLSPNGGVNGDYKEFVCSDRYGEYGCCNGGDCSYASTANLLDPNSANQTVHPGYDIALENGTPFYAPIGGVVLGTNGNAGGEGCTAPDRKINECNWAYDNGMVIGGITDGEGQAIYINFDHTSPDQSLVGQTVQPGQPLGVGLDKGHVHVESHGYCPDSGMMVVLDPSLVMGGYYNTHSVCEGVTRPAS